MIAVDIDDTILRRVPGAPVDWNDPDSVLNAFVPHEEARVALEAMRRLHGGVAYITGRCRDVPGMEAATHKQLEAAQVPHGPVILQPAWRGWDALAWWKAWAIQHVGARGYVGDTEHDRLAAERAGVRFVRAEILHAVGRGLRHVVKPTPNWAAFRVRA